MRCFSFFLLLILIATSARAQSTPDDDLQSLRRLVEAQAELIATQGERLDALKERVAALEGKDNYEEEWTEDTPDGTDSEPKTPTPTSTVAANTAATGARDVPSDRDDIGLQHKQELRTGKEVQIIDDAIVLNENVDLFGSFRIFTEAGSGDPTLNDGSSRLGLRFARAFRGGQTLFGRTEWKVNLVDSDSEFQTRNADGGGIIARQEEDESVLSTRLGYLGMRWDDVGELSFGKQWSVYYDVAGWTDNFNIYGGSALSVYPAGTDGGILGSGRADNAVIWRNKRGVFSYGIQTQLKTTTDGSDYRGLGASLIASPSVNWDIGFAFAGARVEGDFESITGDAESGVAVLGARYHNGPWNAALSVASWKNHEAIFFDDDTLVFDGVGAELFLSYEYSRRLQLYGGFNFTDPDVSDPRVDKDFGIQALILGSTFYTTKESFAYIEALLSNGADFDGKTSDSLLSIGYRFDF